MKELFVDWFGIAGVEIFHISIYMLCYCAICSLWEAFIRKMKSGKDDVEHDLLDKEEPPKQRETQAIDWVPLQQRRKQNAEIARLTKERLQEELRRSA